LPAGAKIFLSHAHQDAAEAHWLAKAVQDGLAFEGLSVEIFSTSEPHYRFLGPSAEIAAGDDLRDQVRRYSDALRAYLDEQIADSAAYLLVVTPHTAETSRPWIRWEIQEASKIARQRGLPFAPCLLGVEWEALRTMASAQGGTAWEEAEIGVSVVRADPAEFQGIRVDEPEGLHRLTRDLATALTRSGAVSPNA
jgi:hypothetical protein